MLLSKIRPEDFQLYVDWTYDNTLEAATASDTPVTRLLRLYLLGKQLGDNVLCLESMDQLEFYDDLDTSSESMHLERMR